MNLENIWAMVGDFGRFQKWSLVHWSVVGILNGMNCLSYVLVSVTPPFRCFVPGCHEDSSPFNHVIVNATNRCSYVDRCRSGSIDNDTGYGGDVIATPCHRWIYDPSEHVTTVVTKWDLVCDNANLLPFTQSVLMAGTIFGSALFGYLADRFGRKPCTFVAVFLSSVAGVLCPFMPQYWAFLILRFVVGACSMGSYIVSWSYVLEIIGAKQRLLISIVLNMSFACGEVLVGLIGYFVHDWSTLVWIISTPGFLWLVIQCWFCESPRWLITSKNYSKAQKAFEQIASFNGRKIDFGPMKLDQLEVEENTEKTQQHYTTFDLFRHPKLRWITINLTFNWFTNTLSYYGISMSFPSIDGNPAIGLIIVSLIEFPSCLFLFFILDKFGRKIPLVATLILGGIAGICTAPVALQPNLRWLFFCLILLSKFCCAAAFSNLFLFSNEIFPTVLRSNGVGLCSFSGHIAAILSPYLAKLNVFHPALPLIVFGCFSLMSGVAAIMLPETKGKRLPDKIEDMESGSDSRADCKNLWWKLLFFRNGVYHVSAANRLSFRSV